MTHIHLILLPGLTGNLSRDLRLAYLTAKKLSLITKRRIRIAVVENLGRDLTYTYEKGLVKLIILGYSSHNITGIFSKYVLRNQHLLPILFKILRYRVKDNKSNVNLVHSFYLYPTTFSVLLVMKLFRSLFARTKLIASVVGIDVIACKEAKYGNLLNPILNKLTRFTLENVDVIHVHSDLAYKLVSKLCKGTYKLRYIPRFIDDAFLKNFKQYNLSNISAKKGIILLYYGRLAPFKNLRTLLTAFKYLKRHLNDKCIRILVIGAKSDAEKKKLLSGVDPDIYIRKWKNSVEIAKILNNLLNDYLIVFTHPALIDLGPKTIIEAMSLGLPILITKTTGKPFEANDYPLLVTIRPTTNPQVMASEIITGIRYISKYLSERSEDILSETHRWRVQHAGKFTIVNVSTRLALLYLAEISV